MPRNIFYLKNIETGGRKMKNNKPNNADNTERREIDKNIKKQLDREIEKALDREFKKYPHVFVKVK